jgi:PAS domain S-box-containing protein
MKNGEWKNNMDDTYERRKIFAEALNKSLGKIVSEYGNDIGTVLTHGLRPVADAVAIDQIVVYRLLGVEGERHFGQVYRWANEDGGTTSIIEELKVVPDHPAVVKWIEICDSGDCVNIHIGVSSEAEAAFLTRYGAKSLMLSPVLIKGKLWGAVAFQDHTSERYFDDLCVEFLSSSAHICANALIIDETAKALIRSNELTNALNKMSEIFLTQSGKSFEEMMSTGGKLLAELAEVDRFSLLRNTLEDGVLYMTQIYRWEKTSGGTTKPNENFIHVTYKQIAPEWERMYKEGKALSGPARLMPEREAALFKNLGTLSAYAAPVHINGVPWGFVLFEDQKKERYFDDELSDSMRSAAFLFANTVIRAELENTLATERDFTQRLLDAAPVGINIWDDNFNLIGCNDAIQKIFGKPKQYYIDNFFEFSPEYQPNGVKSVIEVKESLSRVRLGETITSEWTHCSADGEIIPCEVTQTNIAYNNKQIEVVYIYDLRNIKKMEEAALKAEQMQVLIDATPLSCTLLDKDGNIYACNKSAVEFFRLSKKEDIQRMFDDLVPENQPDGRVSRTVAIEWLRKAYDEGYVFIPNWIHKSLDGELLPCEVTLVRVEYGGDYVIAGYVHDMREMNASIAKIREADERANILFNFAPYACFMYDKDGVLIDCNQEVVKMFGITDKEYFKRIGELSPEYQLCGTLSSVKANINSSLAIEKGFNRFEWIHKKKNGEHFPAEVTLVRVNYRGEYVIAGYIRDLTEQKKAEQLTKLVMEKTSTLTTILDTTPDLIFCKDLDSRYTLCNKSFEKLVNIPRENIIGKNDIEGLNVSPEIAAEFAAEDRKIFSENQVVMFEDYLLSHDGTRILFETIKSPLVIDGKVTGLVGIARNITQRREMARQQAEAEAANRAKSSFLATMSHEMRTPMNAIIGMTSIGKNAESIERKNYALDKIENAAMHLLSVINDVLDISKIEANKLELAPVEFNLERMLQKIVNIINFRMDEKHQKFTVNVDRNIPRFVIGDDHRLSQVIMNLLSNAVKFSPENGEIDLDVSLIGEENGICELRIEVSDNGIGISPEQKAKLFNAFQQADSGISREFGGTGLGLSISKHIVELMGGKIRVESEFGKGSCFIFTVKVERGEKNIASMLAPGIKWENLRILVVDDERGICTYFEDLLGQLGLNCRTAIDGFDAFKTIEEYGTFDIYFIDWRMPGMDGMELTRKIKVHDQNRPSVVVMISSVDWTVIKDTALDAGVSKYILKPLFSSAIIDCINECLGLDNSGDDEIDVNTSGKFARKKLLIVEDVEINREIMISLLEDTGINIECAQNGLEAVEMVAASPDKFDIILMDVQMPKMDGFEATRLIRALTVQRIKNLPIIALTAHVFKSDVEDCLAAGMNDHIGKPLDIEDVMNKLNKYLIPPVSEIKRMKD